MLATKQTAGSRVWTDRVTTSTRGATGSSSVKTGKTRWDVSRALASRSFNTVALRICVIRGCKNPGRRCVVYSFVVGAAPTPHRNLLVWPHHSANIEDRKCICSPSSLRTVVLCSAVRGALPQTSPHSDSQTACRVDAQHRSRHWKNVSPGDHDAFRCFRRRSWTAKYLRTASDNLSTTVWSGFTTHRWSIRMMISIIASQLSLRHYS